MQIIYFVLLNKKIERNLFMVYMKQAAFSIILFEVIFYSTEREIYSIPYDDICYPEKAIEIMTDNIIRNIDK